VSRYKRGHVLKQIKKLSYPKHLIFVDSETNINMVVEPKGKVVKYEVHTFKLATACYVKLDENMNIAVERWISTSNPADIHDFIVKHAPAWGKLFVFAHNFHFDFPVLKLYELISKYNYSLVKAVFDSDVFFVKLKKNNSVIFFVDSTNFFKAPLRELGEILGYHKLEVDFKTASLQELIEYNKRDVEILKRIMLSFLRFLKEHNLPFRLTLAGTAFASFRARFMNHKIFIHDNPFVLELERNAYYGGRNEVFQLGRFEKIHVFDFNSLYPYVMRTYPIPTRLIELYDYILPKDVEEKIRDGFLTVAEVWVETDKPYYPYRNKGKLLFPIGRFKTFLATPELKIALENNHVVKLGRTAVYDGSIVFKDYVDFFYNLRLKYKSEDNNVFQHMAKILMNSLYGKFSQRVRELKYIRNIDPEIFEVEDVYLADEEKRVVFKRLLGKEFVLEESERLSYNSFPAIASHITSYARVELLKAIETAGWDNVYYVDTDSVFVNDAGREALEKANLVDSKQLGKLKHEYTADIVEIRGPKDYTIYIDNNRVEKIKGVNKKAQFLGDNKYLTLRFNRFNSLMRKKSKDAVIVDYVIKELKRVYDKGIVLKNGQVRPFVLSEF